MGYADLDDVEKRLDFELDEQGQINVEARLDDASEMARALSGRNWPEGSAPRIVRTIVLNCVVRYMRNPDALIQSRAGDETLIWSDQGETGSFYFTKQEVEMLSGFKLARKFGSIGTYAWGRGRVRQDIEVGTGGGGTMPFIAAGERVPMTNGDGTTTWLVPE